MILKKLNELEILPNDVLEDNGIDLVSEDEIFVPVEGWPKYYISNYGRLLSAKHDPWLILQPHTTTNGYSLFSLSNKKGIKQGIPASHLVYQAFYDVQYPKSLWPYLHGHHRNRKRDDNFYKNIEPLLNNHHRFSHRVLELLLFRGKGIVGDNRNYKDFEDVLACEVGVTLPELMDALINADTVQPYLDKDDTFAYKMVKINDATVFVRLHDDQWQQAMQATDPDADDTAVGGDSNDMD